MLLVALLVVGSQSSVEEKLTLALKGQAEVLSMTNAELAKVPQAANTGLSEYYVDTPAFALSNSFQFWRVADRSITPESFRDAWISLYNELGIFFSDENEICLSLIASLWIVRPRWFVPSRRDLSDIRDCLDAALALALSAEGPGASVVASVVTDVTPAVFSAETELYLRSRNSLVSNDGDLATRWAAFVPVQDFVLTSSAIADLLEDGAAGQSAAVREKPEDLFNSPIGDSVHAGDIVDFVWFELALKGEGDKALPLYNLLFTALMAFDESELHFEAQKRGNVETAFLARVLLNERGRGRAAWDSVIGEFLNDLVPQAQVDNCFNSAGNRFDIVSLNPYTSVMVYRCLTAAVELGQLVIADNERKAHNVATLMHLVRMGHGSLAFLLHLARKG